MKPVAIIVLNWNGWEDTVACLHSLMLQGYPGARLMVVDNGSTDGSEERIRQAFPMLEVLQTHHNLGFGGGCNVGIRHALKTGVEYIWLINSDARAAPDALAALVEHAEANPRAGLVGSVIYEMGSDQRVQLWGGGIVNLLTGSSRHRRSPGDIDFVSGASMLLRRDFLEQVGPFDEAAFFMYWEDTDLGFRARKAGWQLAVATRSQVWHKQSASLGRQSPKLDEYFTRSGSRFFNRHAPWPAWSVSMMLFRMLSKRLLLADVRRLRAVIRGVLAA